MDSAKCNEWKAKKTINPLTKRKISTEKAIYKKFEKFCDNETLCESFEKNDGINPITKRKIKTGGDIFKFIKSLCSKTMEREARTSSQNYTYEANMYTEVMTDPLSCLEYKSVTLKEHQKTVCGYVSNNIKASMLLFHSVGSGKTITSITIIRCILEQKPNKKVFVLVPKSLIENFKKEMRMLDVLWFKPGLVTLTTHAKFTNRVEQEGPDFCKNSIIIVDEAHHYTSFGITTQRLHQAALVCSNLFLLTATPISNNVNELIPYYLMLNKIKIDTKPNAFYRGIVKYIKDNGSEIFIQNGFENKVSYFINSDKTDYPSVTYENIFMKMGQEYYKLYKKIEDNMLDELGGFNAAFGNNKNITVFLNGIRRAVNMVSDTVISPKTDWVINRLKEKQVKTLIYSNWIEFGVKMLQKKLRENGISFSEITGSMNIKDRNNAMLKYNNDETLVLFITSAGSEGLDLKGTREVIIMEPHWHNEKINQVVGRAVRYKSHAHLNPSQRKVKVFNLIIEKPDKVNGKKINYDEEMESADKIVYKINTNKLEVIRKIYDQLISVSIENTM